MLPGQAASGQASSRIGPLARIAYLGAAALLIHLGLVLDVDHPVQLAMDVLAPMPFLLLAATDSYRSALAKTAFVAALLLWAAIIAQPHLHPKPWWL